MAPPLLTMPRNEVEEELARGYLDSQDSNYARCICSDCERFKGAAEAIATVHCAEDDAVAESVIEAQKSLWRTRKALHKLHMPELYITDVPITAMSCIYAFSRNRGKVRYDELTHCYCDKCDTLFRRYRDVRQASSNELDAGKNDWGLRLIIAAQNDVHRDSPYIFEREEDTSIDLSAALQRMSSTDDDGDNDARDCDAREERAQAVKLFHGAQKNTRKTGTADKTHVDHGGYHNKFIVCDHCMAHGLPCNEASVCDQCHLFGQACVHRWCRDSPASKLQCQNNNCRYTHRDSIAAQQDGPRWIILPGKLPRYWSKARIASKTFQCDSGEDGLIKETSFALDQRQENAINELRASIATGAKTLLTMRFSCSCELRNHGGHAQHDPEVEFEESFERQTIVDQLHGQLEYLNEFLPPRLDDQHEAMMAADAEDDVEIDQGQRHLPCVSCGREYVYYSLAPCDHRTCIKCALTRRMVRKDPSCFECGKASRDVWFTPSAEAITQTQDAYGWNALDAGRPIDINISFANDAIREYTRWLWTQLNDMPVSRGGETAAFYLR
ncbi:hypothetical protein CKM354_000627700 [Cercospora kikuchii]|uniref:RING-type domain-containing protein n=1 Tax=Cercospora kikuchii TaxID=84275 RepID=A0A9P3CRC3_9PEZI|nr:uncharacterized protein CKM354_000627700 [Cercospora kikuchii]GIZ43033.1 hypothetical protein CKM354_000627700 [Cercospora kikuchii]